MITCHFKMWFQLFSIYSLLKKVKLAAYTKQNTSMDQPQFFTWTSVCDSWGWSRKKKLKKKKKGKLELRSPDSIFIVSFKKIALLTYVRKKKGYGFAWQFLLSFSSFSSFLKLQLFVFSILARDLASLFFCKVIGIREEIQP